MATITHTWDGGSPNLHTGEGTGTFTTATTAPTTDQLVLFGTSVFIKNFTATNQTGIGSLHAVRNQNSAGTTTNGTVAIRASDPLANSYDFVVHFSGS